MISNHIQIEYFI